MMLPYAPQSEPQYITKTQKNLNTIKLIIGFRTCSQYSPDKYGLNLLTKILGGYMGSRLFTVLREKNGLTYSSFCNTCYYNILGDISIFTETDPSTLLVNKGVGKGVLPLIIDILRDLQKKGITKNELDISKNNLRGSLALDEANATACFYNGSKMLLYDDTSITPYREIFDTYYKHITQTQIHDIIKKYFTPANMTVCILGEHIPSMKKIKQICERMD
jgi:predicted Zn-dependent peptidase